MQTGRAARPLAELAWSQVERLQAFLRRHTWISRIPQRFRTCSVASRRSWTSTSTRTRRRFHGEVEENRRKGNAWLPTPDRRGAEAQGAGRGPVEPVPAGVRARRRAHEPRVRAAVRDHGPLADRPEVVQLLGARHRQHGSAATATAPSEQKKRVARAAARRRDPLRLRDDRAGGGFLGRDQHRGQHRARRRRVRDQRPQVVDVGRRRSALQDPDLHGQDRPEQRRTGIASSR